MSNVRRKTMGMMIRFQDNSSGCFARVDWESGEPALISIAQTGVLVRRSRLGIFGTKLYDGQNLHDCVAMSRVLDNELLSPESLVALPPDLTSPVLQSFTRLALETKSAAEFCAKIGAARQCVLAGGEGACG